MTSQVCILLQLKSSIRAVGLAAASVDLFFPRKNKALTVCIGVDYICVSLGVPEPDFLLSVLTVAPPIKEGIIKYIIKEGTYRQSGKRNTDVLPRDQQRDGRSGATDGGCSIMRVMQFYMIIFLLCTSSNKIGSSCFFKKTEQSIGVFIRSFFSPPLLLLFLSPFLSTVFVYSPEQPQTLSLLVTSQCWNYGYSSLHPHFSGTF